MGRMTTTPPVVMIMLLVALAPWTVDAQVPGFDLKCDAPLGIDEAMLFLRGFRDLGDGAYPLAFDYQSTNCHGCDLMPLATLVHANATVCAKVSTKWPTRLRASWTVEGTNAKPPTQLIVRSVERTVKLTEKAMVTVEVAGNAAAADGTPAGPAEAPYALLVAQAGGYPTYRPLLYLVWAGLGLLCLGWLLRQFTKGSPVVKWLLRHLPQPPAAVAEPPPDPPVLAAPRPRVRLDRRDPPARPAAGAGAGVGRDAMSPSYLALNEEEGLLDEEEMLYREFEAHQQALQGAQAPGEPAQPPVEEQPQEPRAEEMEGQQHAEPLSATGAKQRRRSALKEGVDRISSSSTTTGERALSHGAAVAEDSDESSSSRAKRAASQPPLSREKALDVLRGLSVLGMVFVNYGGGGYAIFAHSAWDGLTLADLLFPAFVFVSGAAAALSLRRLQQRLDALLGPKGQDESRRARKRRARRVWAVKREALGKVGRRALVLFVLGLFLNNGYEISHWRVPGVLQYLAWCNLLVPALLILAARGGPPADPTTTTEAPRHLLGRARLWSQRLTRLLLPTAWWEPCAALLLPTLHLALAYLIRAPGCPRGYVGPGGAYVDGGRLANCTGGAHGYLDRLLFSSRHVLQDPPCRAVYGVPGPFDPEGAVGSLNAAFLFYVGALAGRVLLAPVWRPRDPRRALGWLALAAPCVLLAAILGGSGAVPVNKSLWSLSFVLATAAVALAALAACHLLCDAFQVWPSGAPCAAVGRNALLVYVGHELLQDYFPFSFKLPASLENTHGGALLEDTVGVLVWMGIGALLHWWRVYIKV